MQASWRTPMPAQSLQQNPCYGTDREVEVDSRRRGVPRQAVTRDGHPDRVARGGPSRAHLVARAHRRQEGPRRRAVPVPVRADPRVAVDEDLAEPRARCPARRAADAEQERRRRVRPPPRHHAAAAHRERRADHHAPHHHQRGRRRVPPHVAPRPRISGARGLEPRPRGSRHRIQNGRAMCCCRAACLHGVATWPSPAAVLLFLDFVGLQRKKMGRNSNDR